MLVLIVGVGKLHPPVLARRERAQTIAGSFQAIERSTHDALTHFCIAVTAHLGVPAVEIVLHGFTRPTLTLTFFAVTLFSGFWLCRLVIKREENSTYSAFQFALATITSFLIISILVLSGLGLS